MSLKANIKYVDFYTKELIESFFDVAVIPALDDCVEIGEEIYLVKGRIFSYIEDTITKKYIWIEITIFLQAI